VPRQYYESGHGGACGVGSGGDAANWQPAADAGGGWEAMVTRNSTSLS